MVCGFSLPSRLVSLAAWEPEVLGLLGYGSLRTGSRGMAFSRNIELEDLAWSPSTLASGSRAVVPILVTGSPAGASLSFCVSYVMPLRTILETSRPACD